MRSIKKEFILTFSLLSVLSLILLGIFYSSRFNANKDFICNRENYIVNLQSQVVNKELMVIINDLILLAEHTKLAINQESDFSNNKNSIYSLTSEFEAFSLGRGRYYDQIRYINEKGDEIIRINLKLGNVEVINRNKLQNKKDRYYFKDIVGLNPGEIYISPMDLNIEHNKIEQPIKPMIRLGTPIHEMNGNIRGIVIINYLAKTLLDVFDENAEISFGQNYFLNKEGYWLRSNNPENNWAFMYPERINQTFGNSFPNEWQQISVNKSGQFSTKNGLFTYTTLYPLSNDIISSSGSNKASEPSQELITSDQYYWKLISFITKDQIKSLAWPIWKEFIVLAVILNLLMAILTAVIVTSKTKRKKAEQALKESHNNLENIVSERTHELTKSKEKAEKNEMYFRKLIEKSPLPMVITDENQDIEFFNEKFTQLFGYTLNDVSTAKEWWKIAYPDVKYRQKVRDSWMHAIVKAIKNNTDIEVQVWDLTIKDSTKRTCEFYMVPLGNISLIVMNDITEKRKNQNALIKAKDKAERSDQLKAEFLRNMSHEVRTPLNGIMGFSSMLNKANLKNDKRQEYIDIIQSSGDQLLRIIDDILEISKFETKQIKLNTEEVCLNKLLQDQFNLFEIRAKKNNTLFHLKKELSDEMSFIQTDKSKLIKILSNLLENAFKYTKDGSVEIGYLQKDNYIEIYVKDTGIGISPDKFEKIFERFSQEDDKLERSASGLGLGLSIAKENTELLDGKIWLVSNKGIGTTFFVTIPIRTSPIPSQ